MDLYSVTLVWQKILLGRDEEEEKDSHSLRASSSPAEIAVSPKQI